jgi:hypothetical protein
MDHLDLARRLRRLRRTLLMLQTELRHGHLEEALLDDVERQMEHGIATEPRCASLREHADALRESTLTPRRELYADTIRAGDRLKSAIDDVLNRL